MEKSRFQPLPTEFLYLDFFKSFPLQPCTTKINTKVSLSPTSSLLKGLLFSPRQQNVPDFPKEKHFSVNWRRSWNIGVPLAENAFFFLYFFLSSGRGECENGVKPLTLETWELKYETMQLEIQFCNTCTLLPSLNFSDFSPQKFSGGQLGKVCYTSKSSQGFINFCQNSIILIRN